MTDALHPAAPLLVAALLAAVTPPALRRLLLPAAGTAALALAWSAPEGGGAVVTLMGQPLSPLRVDALGRAFAIVFAIVTALGGVYALDVERRRFQLHRLLFHLFRHGAMLSDFCEDSLEQVRS